MSSSPEIPQETALKHETNSSSMTPSPLSSSPATAHPSMAEKPTAPVPLPARNAQTRPLSEIIGETFPPFDHQANIVSPFNDEANRDLAFERDLSAMLLDLIIETHAWASARPKHESTLAAHKIEQKIVSVIEAEKQQEKTRERLNEFVTRMKTALAALTGLGV